MSKRATCLEIQYSVRLISFELVKGLSLCINWRLQIMLDLYDVLLMKWSSNEVVYHEALVTQM